MVTQSITTTELSRRFVGGCITLTSFPQILLRRYYHHEDKKRLLPAINKEQLDILVHHALTQRDKVTLNLLWYSGMRLSEAANVKAQDFDWDEGTVVVLGKGNKYRKAIAGNRVVKDWFVHHDSFERSAKGIKSMLWRLANETGIHCNAHSFRRGFCVHQVKSGLSTRVVQTLGGWEQLSMVEHYSKSLTFDDALQLYKKNVA